MESRTSDRDDTLIDGLIAGRSVHEYISDSRHSTDSLDRRSDIVGYNKTSLVKFHRKKSIPKRMYAWAAKD